MNSDEFVQLMVLDGCFMLELFCATVGEGFEALGYSQNDPVFAGNRRSQLVGDMIMLENQIPLIVLDRLLSLQRGNTEDSCRDDVVVLILCFFSVEVDFTDKRTFQQGVQFPSPFGWPFDDASHWLDIIHRKFMPELAAAPHYDDPGRKDERGWQQLIHCVTELRKSGIRFISRESITMSVPGSGSFGDIQFSDGVLQIPQIFIYHITKSGYLNLIALEQCKMAMNNQPINTMSSYMTSYVMFMYNLINSVEDVRYLNHCGILKNRLGSDEEVAEVFNGLCKEVTFNMRLSYLSPLSEQINFYYDRRRYKWWASLKQKYFGNPWTILSLAAAVVLLLLTAAQTFFAVYSYFRPPG